VPTQDVIESRSGTVLVVDPCAGDRARVQRFLTDDPACRWDLTEASTASEAAARLGEAPDVLLVDPLADPEGIELLSPAVRGEIPLLLLVGDVRPNPLVMFDDCLEKGELTPQSLRRALRIALEERALRAELARCRIDLESSGRTLEQVGSVIARDLRPSVQAMLIEAELVELTQGRMLGPQARQQLDDMIASASRMSSLVEDLLRLTRCPPGS
jgi:signal transduction histidine kinase